VLPVDHNVECLIGRDGWLNQMTKIPVVTQMIQVSATCQTWITVKPHRMIIVMNDVFGQKLSIINNGLFGSAKIGAAKKIGKVKSRFNAMIAYDGKKKMEKIPILKPQ